MPVKQTQNGEVKVRNTTKLQLNSLDAFAMELGYKRGNNNQYVKLVTFWNERFRQLWKQKPCIDFNTMVEWHNGAFKPMSLFLKMEETIQHTGLPLGLYKIALDARKVKQVKIQRKKDTTLVVQDHLVELI